MDDSAACDIGGPEGVYPATPGEKSATARAARTLTREREAHVTDHPHRAGEPVTRIIRFLGIALDIEAPTVVRQAAWENLRDLPPDFLLDLAGDAEWHVLRELMGEAGELPHDLPGERDTSQHRVSEENARAVEAFLASLDDDPPALEGPGPDAPSDWVQPEEDWSSSTDRWDAEGHEGEGEEGDAPLSLSGRTRNDALWLAVYDRDLRRLIHADFADEMPVLERPDAITRPLRERVDGYAAARRRRMRPSEAFVRSVAWTTTNHGIVLADIHHRWPDRPSLIAAFFDESLNRPAHRGLPPLVARSLEAVAADRPDTWCWMDTVVCEAADRLESRVHEFLDPGGMQRVHFDLRVEIARHVRQAEVMNPHLVAAVELAASTQMLRTAAFKDLLRAWQEGEGNPRRALKVYRGYDLRAEMLSEFALRGILWQPEAPWVEALAPGAREALAFRRQVRKRAAEINGRGLLNALGL